MRKILLIVLAIAISVCSNSKEKRTKINIAPPDFIKKELTAACEKPENADTWMVLVEHNHFKCTGARSRGDRVCYGWYLEAWTKCTIKGAGVQKLKYDGALSFGNSSLAPNED